VLGGDIEIAGPQQRLGPLVGHDRPELGQRHRLGGERRHVGELLERGAAPGTARIVQRVGQRPRVPVRVADPVERGPHAVDVPLVGTEDEPVPGAVALEPVGARPEVPAQPGDLALQGVAGRVGRVVAPHRVDQPVGRDRRRRRGRQQGEDGAAARARDRHLVPVDPHPQRAEQVDLQSVPRHQPRAVRASGGSAPCT
jgi:hypothetical protein